MEPLCTIDDKTVPLYRIVWVSDLPHFCGGEDCQREGMYEVRLEGGDALWATSVEERDTVVERLREWLND
jgi:hypothetical protein